VSLSHSSKSTMWVASISQNNKSYYLGLYNSEEEAAMFYDLKALELYGENAKLNFPDITFNELQKKCNIILGKYIETTEEKLSKILQGKKVNLPNKTSKYVGVSLKRSNLKWLATITKNRKGYSLGTFDSEIEAAKAYDKKALELYGENAKLNFPIE